MNYPDWNWCLRMEYVILVLAFSDKDFFAPSPARFDESTNNYFSLDGSLIDGLVISTRYLSMEQKWELTAEAYSSVDSLVTNQFDINSSHN